MPKAEIEPLEKVTTRIFKSDAEWLRLRYPTVKYNKVIRTLIRKHRQQVEAKDEKRNDEYDLTD